MTMGEFKEWLVKEGHSTNQSSGKSDKDTKTLRELGVEANSVISVQVCSLSLRKYSYDL